jgi:hypothetical protein
MTLHIYVHENKAGQVPIILNIEETNLLSEFISLFSFVSSSCRKQETTGSDWIISFSSIAKDDVILCGTAPARVDVVFLIVSWNTPT